MFEFVMLDLVFQY